MNNTLEILYDHYKDTYLYISELIKKRDRLMMIVIIVVGFFSFQSIFPDAANRALLDAINSKLGINIQIGLSTIGNIVWLSTLLLTLRYFQVVVLIERLYTYIHKTEDNLNEGFGGEIITREGKSYLNDYPRFSEWMDFLYKTAFPVLLLLVTLIRILSEWSYFLHINFSFSLLFNTVIFILLTISIVLYLVMVHSKDDE